MNISKEVLELDFFKIYNNLELESKNGYDKYIKYMQLPKCITSFVMYFCDVINSKFKFFNYKINLKDDDIIAVDNNNGFCSLYNLYYNQIHISNEDLIKFNKQIP